MIYNGGSIKLLAFNDLDGFDSTRTVGQYTDKTNYIVTLYMSPTVATNYCYVFLSFNIFWITSLLGNLSLTMIHYSIYHDLLQSRLVDISRHHKLYAFDFSSHFRLAYLMSEVGVISFQKSDWNHVVVSWDGRKARLFANGIRKGHFRMRRPYTSGCPIYFAGKPGGSGLVASFKGWIDQVRAIR